jgi:hypothetical protein
VAGYWWQLIAFLMQFVEVEKSVLSEIYFG